MNTTLTDAAAVDLAFTESGDLSIVVVTALDDHLIIGTTADGEVFYQGMPMAENEEGTKVDPNNGWVEDLPHQAWPLTVMVRADRLPDHTNGSTT